MTSTPTEAAFDERAAFVYIANTIGVPRAMPARADVVERGPDGDCWSHAWNYARSRGLHYVEGSVVLEQNGERIFVRAHAWCEDDTAMGTVVHEVTEGYEGAILYQGVRVPSRDGSRVAQLTAPWDEIGMRGSVIELLVVNGLHPIQIGRLLEEG